MTNAELETCIQAYGKDIYSFCRYLAGCVQEAEDLYQDTFLKAVELNEKIDMHHNPKSYLLAVAVRIWKNRKRRYAWRKRIVETKMLPGEKGRQQKEEMQASAEQQVLLEEEAKAVRKAVAGLPERLRVTVLLYYMEGLTVAQISSVAGIPQGTVKSRLYQARKALAKELEVVLNEQEFR